MRIAILGASSFLGERLLHKLEQRDGHVTAFTRNPTKPGWRAADDWQGLTLDVFVSLAPLWVLSDYLERIEAANIKRVVALSSTSRFAKESSPDPAERALAERLKQAETQLEQWALERQIEWVILRPTLIYGFGRDKNITEIARVIERFGIFPLVGKSRGLRQPVHADDVVQAALSALTRTPLRNGGYNLSGGETLPYHAMVRRTFEAMGKPPRMLNIPARWLSLMISVMRWLPRYRHLSSALVTRMNEDLVFEHQMAQQHLAFSPRTFQLTEQDLPR